jgi:hypothetical protein
VEPAQNGEKARPSTAAKGVIVFYTALPKLLAASFIFIQKPKDNDCCNRHGFLVQYG